jgi:hypothetical protein
LLLDLFKYALLNTFRQEELVCLEKMPGERYGIA